MNSKSFNNRFSFCVVLLCSVFAFLGSNIPAYAQICNDSSTLHVAIDSLTRTGGNTVTYDVGTETTGDYAADYQNYVDFSESAPGSTVMHSNSGTWSSVGQPISYSYNDQPSVYGPGNYSATSDHVSYASCYGYTSYPGNPVNLSLTVTQPTITVPGGGSGPYAFWYLGGYPNTDNYPITANFTGNPNLGTCSGCSPVYSWQGVDRPGAVSFSSTNSTSTTLTSQTASYGAVYDVSVTFSVDGWSSPEVMINLNTPVGLLQASSNQVSNPGGCSNPSVYGGYDNQFYYYEYDLWNYAISPLTTNESNDVYTDLTTIGSGSWHYSSAWEDDSVWSNYASGANVYPWSNSYEFLDHIIAYNCPAGWTPPPVQPAGLNSSVQSATQQFHAADQTTDQGIFMNSYVQTWYTDHGTN